MAAPRLDETANATFLWSLPLSILTKSASPSYSVLFFLFSFSLVVLTVICYYLCTHALFLSPPGQNPYLFCSLLYSPKLINQSIKLMIFCHRHLHCQPHTPHLLGTRYVPGIMQSAVLSHSIVSEIYKGCTIFIST